MKARVKAATNKAELAALLIEAGYSVSIKSGSVVVRNLSRSTKQVFRMSLVSMKAFIVKFDMV